MKKLILKTVLLFFILVIGLSSCISLKSVNDYSSASLNGINKFDEINYSFVQHCLDRCQFELMQTYEIERELECNCSDYKKADEVTMLICNTVKGYFEGLSVLSGNKLADYNFSAFKKSLTEGTFGNIMIEKEQVNAYTNIAKILLDATTNNFRKNKIKKYVEDANGPVQVLLDKFRFIIQKNLEAELNFKKERLYTYYQNLIMNDSLSEYEKCRTVIDYYQQLSDIDETQKRLDSFAKSLKKIMEGHQKLYDERNNISSGELKEILTGYASDIQDIIAEFNKL